MTKDPSRRDVLVSASALTAAASVGGAVPARAQSAKAQSAQFARVDAALRAAVDAKEVPGVVAMATTDKGLVYEGVFGTRVLGSGPAMTRDTVFRIASMTKAVTCVAAMQLVEQGKLSLEGPLPDVDKAINDPQVLDGFDASGAPQLRPAKRPITLRHLLTHTAGFSYETWDANTVRYVKASGMPSTPTGKLAALRLPLVFDPGDRWEYGINIDWVGRIVETVSGKPLDVYLRDHVFAPLGMNDTGFVASPEQRARQASVHQRQTNGSLDPQPLETPFKPEFYAGGGGLYSTAPDYVIFLQMLLNEGSFNGARILKPETVALMGQNHIGDIEAGILKTTMPMRSNDVDLFPGISLKWGLAYMINMQPGPNGRSAGSLTWAGLYNTYFWIDPKRRVAGTIMTQILPFADTKTLAVYGAFERGIYEALNA
ncbi:MAG: beta-lactamase family protein [Hyphomicrobiales bacterium]|nr:beta-lactamase family protein [Hyphomicrobiales bacterium]MBV8823573.1 beta-lactamase family protein [Hyphomicrobiales bacterium]MBV9429836.1 beta-lactamase family protein [Bradyrhizobiaceae bacterium]